MAQIPPLNERLKVYHTMYVNCSAPHDALKAAGKVVSHMSANTSVYKKIADLMNIKWWQVVGILHYMECDLDLTKHLANGDPLTGDTVRVPMNLMSPLEPPYEFIPAALKALKHFEDSWQQPIAIKDLPTAFDFFERWNGLGYWKLTNPIASPYLWSGTSAYSKGKFGQDGKYDPNLVSTQMGVAVICKALGIRE